MLTSSKISNTPGAVVIPLSSFKKSASRGNYAHVANHWLDNQASDGNWLLIKIDWSESISLN